MRRRSPLALASVVVFALLAAGCGSGSSAGVASVASPATVSTTTPGGVVAGPVAFSRCMRSNGVSTFPDPDRSGRIPKVALERLGVSSARFQAAQRACQHLLPSGGRPPSRTRLRQAKAQGLRFSRCVRAHGVPGFPDPDGSGRIPDPASVHVDQGSPAFRAANRACARYRPPYIPSNAAYETWLRGHAGSGS